MRSPRPLLLATILLASSWEFSRAAEPAVVHGDASLLELLMAAQKTNVASFPRGSLTAEVHVDQANGFSSAVEAFVVWEGERTYWEFDTEDVSPDRPKPLKTRRRMIEDAGILMVYFPSAPYAQIVTDRSAGYGDRLRLRPDQAWFNFEGNNDWAEEFDPAKHPGSVFTVGADGDLIVVERKEANGNLLRIHASLEKGANIVAYESLLGPAGEGFSGEGKYDWVQDAAGNWRLQRYEYQRAAGGDRDQLVTYTLEVSAFDPDPIIAADRFQLESFDLADGTIVEEVGANPRTYRHGDVDNPQDVLEELARKLREEGFAAPDTEP